MSKRWWAALDVSGWGMLNVAGPDWRHVIVGDKMAAIIDVVIDAKEYNCCKRYYDWTRGGPSVKKRLQRPDEGGGRPNGSQYISIYFRRPTS